jgi:hypothetical protein
MIAMFTDKLKFVGMNRKDMSLKPRAVKALARNIDLEYLKALKAKKINL